MKPLVSFNKNIFGILLLISINVHVAEAQKQNSKIIVGNVYDQADHQSLSYSNIYVLGTCRGTVANVEGAFRLDLSQFACTNGDTLVISQIGYRTIKLNLSTIDFASPLKIGLKEDPKILNEVVVKGYTPLQLLKIAAQTTNDSSFSPVILHSYFREFRRKNGHCTKFADASIDYYVKNDGKKKDVRMKLLESRAKASSFKIDSGMNDSENPYGIKAKNFPSASNLVWLVNGLFKNPDDYVFDYAETSTGDDEVFMIVKFNPKAGVKKPLYEGSVSIAKESLFIQTFDWKIAEENKKYTRIKWDPIARERVVSKKASLKFNTIAGHSYLQYARLEGAIRLYNRGKTDVINSFASEMLVNSVSFKAEDVAKFKNEKGYRGNSIYKAGVNYRSNFWEGERSILATEEEEKIIRDLDNLKN